MVLTKNQVRQEWDQDRKKDRKRLIIVLLITILVFLISICFRYNAYKFTDKFVPATYLNCFKTGILVLFNSANGVSDSFLNSVDYLGAIARLKITFMALVSGAALAISGAVFQTIYKNPMASPNIIGASAGVNLGNVIMITLYSSSALSMPYLRYKYCYGLTALCVIGVVFLGKISGNKKNQTSVMEMVMIGSIVSQVISVFSMYFMYNLEDEDLETFQELTMGTYVQIDSVSMIIFTTVMLISILPMLFIRYRFNIVSMNTAEAKATGINQRIYIIVGQVCGVIMVTAAMIHCGQIGMVTMVVPYIVRILFGADFRNVCIYSALIGAIIVMICRLSSSLFTIAGEEMPVTFILNIALTPVFMVILAKRRGGFE